MTSIFISHTQNDANCAESIRHDLEIHGYTVWRDPGYPSPTDSSYPRMIENAILGSAAVILVWSSSAAQSSLEIQHINFAQQLKKSVLPVMLDGTVLPHTLISVSPIVGQVPCTDVAAQLVPRLPSPQSTEPLIKLYEQAAHEFIRERRDAIDHAAEMLKRNEHHEEVLAILEYLAHKDSITGVREKAQEVLDADAKKGAPVPPPGQPEYILDVTCPNGHITYFDKRRVCRDEKLYRGRHAGSNVRVLYLPCGQCGVEVRKTVDCGGY